MEARSLVQRLRERVSPEQLHRAFQDVLLVLFPLCSCEQVAENDGSDVVSSDEFVQALRKIDHNISDAEITVRCCIMWTKYHSYLLDTCKPMQD